MIISNTGRTRWICFCFFVFLSKKYWMNTMCTCLGVVVVIWGLDIAEMNNSWSLLQRNSYGAGWNPIHKWTVKIKRWSCLPWLWTAGCGEWEERGPKQDSMALPCLYPSMKLRLQQNQAVRSQIYYVPWHCSSLCQKCFLPYLSGKLFFILQYSGFLVWVPILVFWSHVIPQ